MKTITGCAVAGVSLLMVACSSGKKEEKAADAGTGFYSVIYTFNDSTLSGISDYGLVCEKDKLFTVLEENGSTLLSLNTDGSDPKIAELHGSELYEGTKINLEYGLIKAEGKLYGVTCKGGKGNDGTIYSVDPSTSAVTIEYDFNQLKDYWHPATLPVYKGNGKIYGLMTLRDESGFAWYEFDLKTKTMFDSYDCQSDHMNRSSSAVYYQGSPDGAVYANDMLGYESTYGYLFRVDEKMSGDKLVYAFDSINGSMPGGRMVFDGGKIYGTATAGGTDDHGLVYSMNADGSDYKILARFDGENGHLPEGLILASDGMLYGTSYSYGKYDEGTMYRLAKDGSGFQVFLHFNPEEGSYPNGALAEDSKGKIYVLARQGGKAGYGAVYCIDTGKIPKPTAPTAAR